jgi:hypothetical protein
MTRSYLLAWLVLIGGGALTGCHDIGAEPVTTANDASCETGESVEPSSNDVDGSQNDAPSDAGSQDEPDPADLDAATVASVLTGRSDACLTCAAGNCANYVQVCGHMAGRATAGPGMGTRKSSLCISVLACLTETECGKKDVSSCYCGPPSVTGDMSDCIKFPDSNSGTCKASFEAAAETTMPAPLLSSLTDTSKALAWAVLLDRCLYDNKCTACFSPKD